MFPPYFSLSLSHNISVRKDMAQTTKDRQREAVIKWQDEQCDASLNYLITSMMGTIIKMFTKLKWARCEKDDLIMQGKVGVILAANKFCRDREGGMFSAIALFYIRDEMLKYANRVSSDFYVPDSRIAKKMRVKGLRMIERFVDAGCTTQDAIERVGDALDIDISYINDFLASKRTVSKDEVVFENGQSIDVIDDTIMGAETRHTHDQQSSTIDAAFENAGLTEREISILKMRYFSSEKGMTMVEISETDTVSRERIRQEIQIAQDKLKEYFDKKGLELRDFL